MTAILTENTEKLNDRSEKPISGSSGNKAQTRKVCVWGGGDVTAPHTWEINLELSEKKNLDEQLSHENMRQPHIADYFRPFVWFDDQQ
jgi:hypothetical protein